MKLFTILAFTAKLLMTSGAAIYTTTNNDNTAPDNIIQKPLIECYNCNISIDNSTDIDTQFNSLCASNIIKCNNSNFCTTELSVDSSNTMFKLDFRCKTKDQCIKHQEENETHINCCDNDLCNNQHAAINLLSTQQKLVNTQDRYKIYDTIGEIENQDHTNTAVADLKNNFQFLGNFNQEKSIIGFYFTTDNNLLFFTNNQTKTPTTLDQYGDPYTNEYANQIFLKNKENNQITQLLGNVKITAVDYNILNDILVIIADNNVFVYHLNTDNKLELIDRTYETKLPIDVAIDHTASTIAISYKYYINIYNINNLKQPVEKIAPRPRVVSEISFSPTEKYLICMTVDPGFAQDGLVYFLNNNNKVINIELFKQKMKGSNGSFLHFRSEPRRRRLFKQQMLLTPISQDIIYIFTCCMRNKNRTSLTMLVNFLNKKRTKETFHIDSYYNSKQKFIPENTIAFASDKHKRILAFIKKKNDKVTLFLYEIYVQAIKNNKKLIRKSLFEKEIFLGAEFLAFNQYSNQLAISGKDKNNNNIVQVYELDLTNETSIIFSNAQNTQNDKNAISTTPTINASTFSINSSPANIDIQHLSTKSSITDLLDYVKKYVSEKTEEINNRNMLVVVFIISGGVVFYLITTKK